MIRVPCILAVAVLSLALGERNEDARGAANTESGGKSLVNNLIDEMAQLRRQNADLIIQNEELTKKVQRLPKSRQVSAARASLVNEHAPGKHEFALGPTEMNVLRLDNGRDNGWDMGSRDAVQSVTSVPTLSSSANAFSSTLSSEPFRLPRAKIAAIFLDYDGCGDIVSSTNARNSNNGTWWIAALHAQHSIHSSYQELAGYLLNAFEQIGKGRDRVILFVGSNRQDRDTDKANAKNNVNGRALGKGRAFEQLAAKYKDKGWELNKALLADRGVLGSAWRNDTKKYTWEEDKVVKTELAENNFKQLQDLGPVDVFFIDDKKEYIDYARHHAKVPEDIRFYTVHYDWYEYATQNLTRELVAEDVQDREHFLWM